MAEAAIVPAINTGVQAREWLAITSHWHSNGFGPVLGYRPISRTGSCEADQGLSVWAHSYSPEMIPAILPNLRQIYDSLILNIYGVTSIYTG